MPTRFILRLGYPWYETQEHAAAAFDFVRRSGCDGVMLFNARGHAEPAHYDRDETLRRAEAMRRAMAMFRDAGVSVSINNLATVGMNFSPPRKERLPFQGLVDYEGTLFPECYCPLDPAWLDYVDFLFRTWAGLGPESVWIDDDFRYKTGAAQCFCPLHLRAFGERTGREWTREQVVAALASDTPLPTPTARVWGELQNEALLRAAERIAAAVREADPRVRLGFMGVITSVYQYGPDYLARLGAVLTTAGPAAAPPLLRPEYGGYSDESRNAWNAYVPLWSLRRAFGDRYEALPEGEVWPFTRFTHSRNVLATKLAWGAVHGFTSTTVNVLDMTEAPHVDDPKLTPALRAAKRHVAAIARVLDDPELRPQGVSLELTEARIVRRSVAGYTDFNIAAARLFARLGVPLWPDGGHARIVVGNAALAREAELADWAVGGLLLDRGAFETLAAMSRDDLLGGARPAPMAGYPCLERFGDDPRNGAAAGRMLSMETAAGLRPVLQGTALPDSPQFAALSRFEDQAPAPVSPAVWARRWEGGRLAALPFSLNDDRADAAMANWKRRWQLYAVLEWLADRPLPVKVEGAADLHVVYRASPSRIVVSLLNLSQDDADGASLVVPALAERTAAAARVLAPSGRWSSARGALEERGRLRLAGPLAVPAMEVRVVEVVL